MNFLNNFIGIIKIFKYQDINDCLDDEIYMYIFLDGII